MKLMNSTKNCNGSMNNYKNKLNSKISLLFKLKSKTYLVYVKAILVFFFFLINDFLPPMKFSICLKNKRSISPWIFFSWIFFLKEILLEDFISNMCHASIEKVEILTFLYFCCHCQSVLEPKEHGIEGCEC